PAEAVARLRRRLRSACAYRRVLRRHRAQGGANRVSDLAFTVLDIGPEPYAAAPNLLARLRITESTGEPVHTIALRCQVQIDPRRRAYSGQEKTDLADLFGAPSRWGET